ncbi:hypothetical protein [Kitasatospora sp. NPDC018619]
MPTSARSGGSARRTTTALPTAPAAPLAAVPLTWAAPAAAGDGFSWG